MNIQVTTTVPFVVANTSIADIDVQAEINASDEYDWCVETIYILDSDFEDVIVELSDRSKCEEKFKLFKKLEAEIMKCDYVEEQIASEIQEF